MTYLRKILILQFAILIGPFANGSTAYALDLEPYKKTCSEIGFKAGTEKHGDCVLKLHARANKTEKVQQKVKADTAQQKRLEKQQQEILASQRRIEQLNRERVAASQKLADKAKTQRRLDGLEKFFNGLAKIGGGSPAPSYGSNNQSSSGFLKSQRVSGFNRICTYSAVGGDKTHTVRSTEICPLQY